MEGRILTPLGTPQRASSGLGARLRQLRVGASLTQSELAGDRFSKEYLSQIERGKTRPTPETLPWIAERLKVDVSYLETGQSWNEYAEVEAAVMRAEAAIEGQQYDEALEALDGLQHSPEAREL
jgi:transcriptional regulator with XRE-family HTH domain